MRRLLLFAVLVGAGCSKSSSPPPEEPTGPAWFEDATDKLGVKFTHDPGPLGKHFMPESMGAGCGLFDADGDGRLDILLLQTAGPESKSTHQLFRQKPDGTFENVSSGSGLDVPGWGQGVAVGDVNNDSKPDVLIAEYGRSRLFLNLGGYKFKDISAEAGVVNPQWGASAAFLDFDRDGWLDLFIVNYLDYDPRKDCSSANGKPAYCSPSAFHGSPSRLFRNNGTANPTFTDVSLAAGFAALPGPGLGVSAADFTGDGWPDLFVANDGKPNRLWVNQKDGTFKDEAASRNVAYTFMGQAYAGMGIAAGDVDNDGLTDLYVTHLGIETNTLWKQGPRGQFKDRTMDFGLTATRWRATGFGTVMSDFDHDGWLDVAVVNGRVSAAGTETNTGLSPYWEPYGERNQLLRNAGGGKLHDISAANAAFCGYFNVGRGLAVGDLDGDGAPDLLVNAIGSPAKVFRNVAPDRGHWLAVRAVNAKANRDDYGAEVAVSAGGGKRVRTLSPSDTIYSSNSPVLHFGLGTAAKYDALDVTWADGTRESFPGGDADKAITVRKGEGKAR
jgi:hypothetical protein